MATRRPFWKWHRWKSIGFCLWPPSTCIWNLKLKFQSKLDLCSGNHVVYRQTDGRTDGQTDGRTRWIQYTPPPTSLGGGIKIDFSITCLKLNKNDCNCTRGFVNSVKTCFYAHNFLRDLNVSHWKVLSCKGRSDKPSRVKKIMHA